MCACVRVCAILYVIVVFVAAAAAAAAAVVDLLSCDQLN